MKDRIPAMITRKTLTKAIVLGGVAGLAAWLPAATWGGNHATDFVFADLRGYEATGLLVSAPVTMLVGIGVVFVDLKRSGNRPRAIRALIIGVASAFLAFGAKWRFGYALPSLIFLLPIFIVYYYGVKSKCSAAA